MQKDVRRLDVAVKDALVVGVVESAGDRPHDPDHVLEVDGAAQAVRKRPALHEL